MILSHWQGGASSKNNIARTEQWSKTVGKNRSAWSWVTDMVEPAARTVSQELSNIIKSVQESFSMILSHWHGGASRKNNIARTEQRSKKVRKNRSAWSWVTDMVEPAPRTLLEETEQCDKKLGKNRWAWSWVTDMVEPTARTTLNPASSNRTTEKEAAWIFIWAQSGR